MVHILSTAKIIKSLVLATGFFFCVAPAIAFNEGAVNKDSFSRNELGVGVYELTIVLGAWGEDLYIPVLGEANLPFASRENRFGFTMERGHNILAQGSENVTAVMLASYEIEDGYYKIPARTLASVKVLALATVDESEGDLYRLRITELPFLLGEDKRPGHFSQGEMKYLYTNYEPLHFERDFE